MSKSLTFFVVTGVFLTMVLGLFALTFGSLLIVIDPYDIIFSMVSKLSNSRFSLLIITNPLINNANEVFASFTTSPYIIDVG